MREFRVKSEGVKSEGVKSEGVKSEGVGSDGVGSEGYLFLDRINRIYRIEIVWEICSSLVPKCHK